MKPRAGLHTAEVELRSDGRIGGISVHVRARVMANADAGRRDWASHTVLILLLGHASTMPPRKLSTKYPFRNHYRKDWCCCCVARAPWPRPRSSKSFKNSVFKFRPSTRSTMQPDVSSESRKTDAYVPRFLFARPGVESQIRQRACLS